MERPEAERDLAGVQRWSHGEKHEFGLLMYRDDVLAALEALPSGEIIAGWEANSAKWEKMYRDEKAHAEQAEAEFAESEANTDIGLKENARLRAELAEVKRTAAPVTYQEWWDMTEEISALKAELAGVPARLREAFVRGGTHLVDPSLRFVVEEKLIAEAARLFPDPVTMSEAVSMARKVREDAEAARADASEEDARHAILQPDPVPADTTKPATSGYMRVEGEPVRSEGVTTSASTGETVVRPAPLMRCEAAWLIENKDGENPEWWVGDSRICWTWDANKATRFARREDADTVIIGRVHGDSQWIKRLPFASEHVFTGSVCVPVEEVNVDAYLRARKERGA